VAENARAKGQRLLAEGRLQVTRVDGGVIAAECRGDSGEVYTLGYHPRTGWLCRCAARGTCSHLRALQLVTVKPTPRRPA
jgi:uncharacterized Zn finger protein